MAAREIPFLRNMKFTEHVQKDISEENRAFSEKIVAQQKSET